jgi:(E)-4-hydroxy-3-methylbut-2-enyl-diphosphate synthase
MIAAYRLLVSRLAAEGPDWNYPIHLGVTEAGDGEDGRIKSAVGIGSLLADGIGDTIRVSLTEDSVHEIPVARELVALFAGNCEGWSGGGKLSFDPFSYTRRGSEKLVINGIPLGGDEVPRVLVTRKHYDAVAHKLSGLGDFQPELVYEDLAIVEIDPRNAAEVAAVNGRAEACLVTVKDGLDLPVVAAFRLLAAKVDAHHPILLKDSLDPRPDPQTPFVRTLLAASTRLGSLLCDGIGDAILLRTEDAPGQTLRLSYNILQAVGARIFKTDYVACPSCGRTLFNLQETTARIKAATEHLKGVKIAIMGCIVNGPGEMADADFGYVGGAPGKVNLYVGKKAVKFNIPEGEAVDRLVDLIKEHGRWVEAPARSMAAAL